jgi:hypothetical protein
MKKIKTTIFLGIIPALLFSCSSTINEMEKAKEKAEKDVEEYNAGESVSFTLKQLVGTWELAEIRVSPLEVGMKPIADQAILMGIDDDQNLAFATEGETELKSNLQNLSSPFTINDNTICSTDTNDIVFKLQFGGPNVKVFLINEKELVLEKKHPSSSDLSTFKYFVRVN